MTHVSAVIKKVTPDIRYVVGNFDGVEYVIIRYGPQYQAIFNYGNGHVSVGIDLDHDPVATIEKIRKVLFPVN